MKAHLKEYDKNKKNYNKLDAREKERTEDSYNLKQIHLLLWLQLNKATNTTIISDGKVGLNNGVNPKEKLVINKRKVKPKKQNVKAKHIK